MRAETGRVNRRRGRLLASISLTALVLAAAAPAALAQDATWLTNPLGRFQYGHELDAGHGTDGHGLFRVVQSD
jgi:hypothetical protein